MAKKTARASRFQQVYEALRDSILNQEYTPGTKLDEEVLASRFKTSRSPVREALRKLAEEELIELVPRGGAFVRIIPLQEALDLTLLREALEGFAGRLAAMRITDEELERLKETLRPFSDENLGDDLERYMQANRDFHAIILQAGRHKQLKRMLNNVYDQIRLSGLRSLSDVERSRKSLKEHWEIVQALEARAADEAERACRRHVRHIRENLVSGAFR